MDISLYHYYYYINIPLLANKSDLLRTPLVVSGVLLLLLLSVEERLQELQPLLNVGRHRRHGGLQQLQPLLQLSVRWRGPDVVKWCVQSSVLVISLFYFLPPEDVINVRPHNSLSLGSPVFLPEGAEKVDWTEGSLYSTQLLTRLSSAQWSMWNVSLGGIHSWSLPALLAREIFWEKHKQLFLFEDLTFPHKFYIYLQDNSVLRWHTLWFIFFSIYQFPWSDKLCNCFWSLNLSIILQLNRGWNIEDCALQINTDILLVQIIWFFSWSEFF